MSRCTAWSQFKELATYQSAVRVRNMENLFPSYLFSRRIRGTAPWEVESCTVASGLMSSTLVLYNKSQQMCSPRRRSAKSRTAASFIFRTWLNALVRQVLCLFAVRYNGVLARHQTVA